MVEDQPTLKNNFRLGRRNAMFPVFYDSYYCLLKGGTFQIGYYF